MTDTSPLQGSVPSEGLYHDFHLERIRAHHKHGAGSVEGQPFTSPRFLKVLVEEVGEVARALNDCDHDLLAFDSMRHQLRKELVQVGAMTAAWVDAIDAWRP